MVRYLHLKNQSLRYARCLCRQLESCHLHHNETHFVRKAFPYVWCIAFIVCINLWQVFTIALGVVLRVKPCRISGPTENIGKCLEVLFASSAAFEADHKLSVIQ